MVDPERRWARPAPGLVTGPGMRTVPGPSDLVNPEDLPGPSLVERTIGRVPGIRLAMVPARVVGVAANAWARGMRRPVYPELPAPRVTPGYLGSLAADELVVGIFKSPRRFPSNDEMHRVGRELHALRAWLGEGGHLDDPASWHVPPPPAPAKVVGRRRVHGVELEHLAWDSGFRLPDGVPGGERWSSYDHNALAHAWIARHPEPGRPWVMCLHGLGTGTPLADAFAFRAKELVEDLGVNVAMPVLPMHGPRKSSPLRVDEFLTHDLVNAVHAVTHAMWDLRGLLGWLRTEADATTIGLHGVSLGGYCAALLSSLDDDLDFVMSGIPLVDIASLYATHAPPLMRRRAVSLGLLGDATHQVHGVISPLGMPSLVAHDRRAIYAGLGDRMSTAAQAHRLWEHWERPRVHWYGGNHVGFVFNREVRTFVDAQLRSWLDCPEGDRAAA